MPPRPASINEVQIRILALISLAPAVYGIALLSDESVAWMNHEYLIFSLPGALLNGVHLQWADLFRGFDPYLFDVIRPRFINYVVTIFNVKLRLLAYEYFIPPANLSLGLVVHLLFAPVLFFALCCKLFVNRWVALLGACLYVASVGFLSSVAIFAQPGKNIIHTLTLALFVALATLHENKQTRPFGEERRHIVALVMFLNLIAVSIDEQYVIVATAAPVLFYRLFLPASLRAPDLRRSARALGLYFAPLAAFALFVVAGAPFVSAMLGSGRCSYAGQFFHYTVDKFPAIPFWPLFADITSTAFAAFFLPNPFPPDMSPFKLYLAGWPLAAVGGCLAVIAALLVNRAVSSRISPDRQLDLPWRLSLSALVYFLMQTMLQRLHEQVTGGFYYESLAAIFISLLVVSLFAARNAGRERFILPCLLPLFMVFQIATFIDLNARWESAHIPLTRDLLKMRNAYPNLVVNENKPRSAEQTARMDDLWRRWKRGEKLDDSLMRNWPVSDGWFLFELNALDGRIFKDAKPKCPGWFPGSGRWNVNG